MSADDVKGREHLIRRQVAMTAVFKRFSAAWPRAFGPATWPTLMDLWIDSCGGVDVDLLEPAARDYLRTHESKFPPKAWEFAKFAKQLQATRCPEVAGKTPPRTSRTWEWISPVTGRITRVVDQGGEWLAFSLDDRAAFEAMDTAGRVAYCEAMVHEYAGRLRRPA